MCLTMSDPVKLSQRSSLGLLVLWLLIEGPKHVYRMQKLIEEQAKDRVVNVRSRARLYQTIQRLQRLGLVEKEQTQRTQGYPERVVYRVTDAGRETAREWLRETLRATGGEFPEFIAAVSILFGLAPDDAREQLEARAEALAAQVAESEAEIAGAPEGLPRLFLLEEEYRQQVLLAELAWVQGVVEDLRSGKLSWSEEWLREMTSAYNSPDEEAADR
jgi:DNA-binding PadR family transcriptional regulator